MAKIYGYDRNLYTVTMDVHEYETNTTGNWSKVGITLWITSKNASYSTTSSTPTFKLWVDGEPWEGHLPSSLSSNSTKTFFTANKTIYHTNDGSKSINFSFNINGGGGNSYIPRNMSASGSLTLTKIPRYTTITDFRWNGQQSETSLGFHWATTDTVSQISYRIDTNAWNTYDENGTSGDFTISGLTAGKQYNFELSVKRKDNGLWTYKTISASTYDYPHPTKNPDFYIGNNLYIEFFNPLKRNVTVNFYVESTKIFTQETTGISMGPFSNEFHIDKLYEQLGSTAKTKRYWFETVYDGKIRQSGYANMYAKESDCKPTIGDVQVFDTDSNIVSATGSDSIFVQKLSKPRFDITNIKSRRGATLTKIETSYDENYVSENISGTELTTYSKTYATSNNTNMYIKVTDSRGFVTSYTKVVQFTQYLSPTIGLKAIRGTYNVVQHLFTEDSGNGNYVKLSITGAIDDRLAIDTSKSKIYISDQIYTFNQYKDYIIGNGVLSTDDGYNIQVVIFDNLGRSITGNISIEAGFKLTHVIENKGIAFGDEAEEGKFKVKNLKLDTGYNEILTKMYELIYQLNTISPDVQNVSNQLENLIDSHTSTSKDLTFYDENWLPSTYVRYTTRTVTQKQGSEYWNIFGLPKDEVYGRSRFVTVNLVNNNNETFVSKIIYTDTGVQVWLRNYGSQYSVTMQVACIYTKAIAFNQ